MPSISGLLVILGLASQSRILNALQTNPELNLQPQVALGDLRILKSNETVVSPSITLIQRDGLQKGNVFRYPRKCVLPKFPGPRLHWITGSDLCEEIFELSEDSKISDNGDGNFVVDMISVYKRKSVVFKGGVTHKVISSLALVAGIACLTTLAYKVLKVKSEQKRESNIYQALDSLMLLWIGVFGACMAVAILAVYRGQGLEALVEGFVIKRIYRTNPYEFLYQSEIFLPAVLIATLAVIAMIITLIAKARKNNHYDSVSPEDNQSAEPAPVNSRYHELDYMKYYQICMIVVLAHFWQYGDTGDAGYNYPAFTGWLEVYGLTHWLLGFVLISGYNAPIRLSDMNMKRGRRLFRILFMYLWCQFLYLIFYYYVFTPIALETFSKERSDEVIKMNNDFTINHDEEGTFQPASRSLGLTDFFIHWLGKPAYVLWYLRSLFVWLLIIPYWLQLKFPIVLSLLVGFVGLYFQPSASISPLDYSLTLEMFPYFVVGATIKFHKWDRWLFELAKNPFTKIVSASLFCFLLSFAFVCPFYINGEWHILNPTFGNIRNKAYDASWWYTLGVSALMLTNLAMIFSTFSLMPSVASYITRASRFSLVPYMLHYMLVLILVSSGFYGNGFPLRLDSGMLWATTVIGFAVAIGLMHPPIASKAMYLINPPFIDWLLQKIDYDIEGKGKKKVENIGKADTVADNEVKPESSIAKDVKAKD